MTREDLIKLMSNALKKQMQLAISIEEAEDFVTECFNAADSVSKWASVKDRLPEMTVVNDYGKSSIPVLCRFTDGHHEDCCLCEGIDGDNPYWAFVQDGDFTEAVTHWKPIPKT